MVQLFTETPSTWTTQAPHWLVSQPTCVPVRPRYSRRNCTSKVRFSTSRVSGLPFTVMVTVGIRRPPSLLERLVGTEFRARRLSGQASPRSLPQRAKKYSRMITITARAVTQIAGDSRLAAGAEGGVRVGGGVSTDDPGGGGISATRTGSGSPPPAGAAPAGGVPTTSANFAKKLSAI